MSDNINDQRGRRASGGANGGMGLLNLVGLLGGGKKKILLLVVIAVVALISNGPEGLTQILGLSGSQQTQTEYKPTQQEQELYKFAGQILAGTEDVWTEIFKQNGKT